MRNLFPRLGLGLAMASALLSPALAQQPNDPLTRFLDSVFKPPAAPPPAAPQEPEKPQAAAPVTAAKKPAPAQAATKKPAQKTVVAKPAPPAPVQAQPLAAPTASAPEAKPAPAPAEPAPVTLATPEPTEIDLSDAARIEAPRPAPEPAKAAPVSPRQTASAATPATAKPSATPNAAAVPSSPGAAVDRVNGYFNAMDQLTATFVQKNPNGQQVEGTLAVKRPGILQFAYAPPSTMEIVSDGRNVAIRDKRLGTNDVYPISQTPLKFLLQENVDLARDSRLKDVQIGRDGMVTVRFDDSSTLGGTSKITLRFDARANALRQWTIVDGQGYETTVVLSNVVMVPRRDAQLAN